MSMDSYEWTQLLKNLTHKLEKIKSILKPDCIKDRLEQIKKLEQDPAFWSDTQKASKIAQEKNILLSKLNKFNNKRILYKCNAGKCLWNR